MELKLAWIINAGYIDLYFKKKMDVTILNANEIIKFSYEKNKENDVLNFRFLSKQSNITQHIKVQMFSIEDYA